MQRNTLEANSPNRKNNRIWPENNGPKANKDTEVVTFSSCKEKVAWHNSAAVAIPKMT